MGKKKDKRERQAREAAGGANGAAPLAGIAAVIAKQLATPAGRQVIAAGLMAAAGAISGNGAGQNARDTGSKPAGPPPAPPEPPISPSSSSGAGARSSAGAGPSAGTGPFAGKTPEPPRGAGPAWPPGGMPPEVAKVIGAVTAGIERWAAGFGVPKPPEPPKS